MGVQKELLIYNIIIIIIILSSGILLFNFYLGDSSIYYIYAKNLSNGYFLNFNLNEFSSGATSPLWAMLIAIPFIIANNIIVVKIFSLIITLTSHLFLFNMLCKLSNNNTLSLLMYMVVAYYTLIYGLMSYEISLLLFFLPLLYYGINYKKKLPIYLTLTLLPLIRPDSILICIVTILYLVYTQKIIKKSEIILLFCTLLPFFLYSLFSYLSVGTYSSSSYCRSFALSENAPTLLGIKYSFSTLLAFISFPSAILLLLINKKFKISSFNSIVILSLVGYIIIFSIVKPIDAHPDRYLVPIFLMLALQISLDFKNRKFIKIVKMILFFLITITGLLICLKVFKYYREGVTFDQVVEKKLVEEINNEAPFKSKILSYEVQSKYYLRNDIDILSLDGIIDGKVAPYLESSDMITFLNKYKPDFWIANNAVNYRQYLKQSKLNEVYNQNQELYDTVFVKNIGFILQKTNSKDLGKLANWKKYYRLIYTN